MTRERTLRQSAVRYATRGWAVFPLRPREKIPLLPKSKGGNGVHDATSDTATVDAWWEVHPHANIGMHCGAASGGIVAVDVDNHLPKIDAARVPAGVVLVSGVDAWPEVAALIGSVPDTLEQRTGGGGRQLFFRLPKAGRWDVKNYNRGLRLPSGRLAAIDLKTDGGYVLLPPSLHPVTGDAYAWTSTAEPAECPPALLDLFFPAPAPAPVVAPPPRTEGKVGDSSARRYCVKVLDSACAAITGAQASGASRHLAMCKAAFMIGGYMAGNPGALSIAEAEGALVAAGIAAGKSEREVRRTVVDGLEKGALKPISIPDRPAMASGRDVPPWPDEPAGYVQVPDEDAGAPEWDEPIEPHDPGLELGLMPKVNVTGRQGAVVVRETWRVVLDGARTAQQVFRLGGKLARLHRHEAGASIELCLPVHVHGLLMRSARWMRTRPARRDEPSKDGFVEIDLEGGPPAFVSADMVSAPHPEIPALEQVVYAPIFGKRGDLLADPGYHASDAVWYEEQYPVRPVPMSLDAARDLLLEWLADFPFATSADRAHAIGLFLLPFVRRMVDGPTPVHLIEAPQPGVGKSLLGQVLMRVAHGRTVPLSPWDAREEERKKTITTYLTTGRHVVFFDNVKGKIESPSFENATTSRRWADRVLGITGEVEVPIHAVWVMTSNNATMSPDMARRSARIRLVRHASFDAATARHPDIEAWTALHHSELVSAALVLVSAWLGAGMPRGGRTLATYEAWARCVGGILAHAGIEGFLDQREAFLERVDPLTAEWRAFVRAWIYEADGALMSTTELLRLADKHSLLGPQTEGATERSRVTRLGAALRARVEQSVDGRVLMPGRGEGNTSGYRLVTP